MISLFVVVLGIYFCIAAHLLVSNDNGGQGFSCTYIEGSSIFNSDNSNIKSIMVAKVDCQEFTSSSDLPHTGSVSACEKNGKRSCHQSVRKIFSISVMTVNLALL